MRNISQDDESRAERSQSPAEGKGGFSQREGKRRRLETDDEVEARSLNAR